MKTMRRLFLIFKRTGAIKIFISFLILMLLASILLTIIEPNIKTIRDGLWYCYVASATIGFGDIYAETFIGRIITVVVSFTGIIITAILTGVIVSYYIEYLKDKQSETISTFLEKLEKLPTLSKNELEDISDKIKKFNNKK